MDWLGRNAPLAFDLPLGEQLGVIFGLVCLLFNAPLTFIIEFYPSPYFLFMGNDFVRSGSMGLYGYCFFLANHGDFL